MAGCGPHCRCADKSSNDKKGAYPVPEGPSHCCKTKEGAGSPAMTTEVAHEDKLFNDEKGENEALYELCKKHGLRHPCG